MSESDDARQDYIAGLRQIAAFLEAHPTLPLPSAPSHLVYCETKAAVVAIARVEGIRWQKDFHSDTYFSLKVEFAGGHVYEAYTERGEICRKIVKGTRIQPAQPEQEVEIVEWVCDEPLLEATS